MGLLSLMAFSFALAYASFITQERIACSTCSNHDYPTALASSHYENLHAAVHRKEHEMKAVILKHSAPSDPVRMAMDYALEGDWRPPLKLAAALRRIYEDPYNVANPNKSEGKKSDVRRGSFIVDIKRKSLSRHGETFARFDDAGMVAEAMVSAGADVVFVNVDYHSYGGDITELRSAVNAVRKVSNTSAVVMKDIVVDEIQLGLAKSANVDGIILMASVLGSSLTNFLDLATSIGLETIVECHTRNEVEVAMNSLAQNILVLNFDRVNEKYYPDQAHKLAGMFPGSGGPIICLAGGGIDDTHDMKKLLAVGYDGVVVGRAVMGNSRAPEFIRAVREKEFLPSEFSQWGLKDTAID